VFLPLGFGTWPRVFPVGFMPADNNKRVIAFIIDSIISAGLTKLSALFLFSGIVQIHPWASMSLQFVLVTGLYWVMMPRFFRGTVDRILSIVPLGLGYWWVSFNPERKTFHDIISKTKVIHYR